MKSAFTLIELLVVMVIIAVLSGLVAAGALSLIFRSKSLVTAKRLVEATTAVGAVGASRGGAAFDLTSRLGLAATTTSAWSTAIYATYADTTLRGYCDTDTNSMASQFAAAGASADTPSDFVLSETVGPWGRVPIAPVSPLPTTMTPISIRRMCPTVSLYFLVEAGVLPFDTAVASYRDDRKTERPWNDRWGNPLVISYLLYQAASGTASTDARRTYGSQRMLYVSAAASGSKLTGGTGNAMSRPTEVWNHALNVASAGDAAATIWDENSFAQPPWRNVKTFRTSTGDAWLLAPMEIR